MTDEESLKFCGQITKASSFLGIGLRQMKNDSGEFYFEFRDGETKVIVKGREDRDRRAALTNACETLVKYLSVK